MEGDKIVEEDKYDLTPVSEFVDQVIKPAVIKGLQEREDKMWQDILAKGAVRK